MRDRISYSAHPDRPIFNQPEIVHNVFKLINKDDSGRITSHGRDLLINDIREDNEANTMFKTLPKQVQDKITSLLALGDFRGAKEIYDRLLAMPAKSNRLAL